MNNLKENIKVLFDKHGKLSSAKIRKTTFKNSTLYREILENTSFLPNNATLSERIYCIKNDINELLLCEICNTNKLYYKRNSHYTTTCNSISCSQKSKNTREKTKNTCLNRYGTESVTQTDSFKYTKEISMM